MDKESDIYSFPILRTNRDAFKNAPPDIDSFLKECGTYLEMVMEHRGFTVQELVEKPRTPTVIQNRYVPEGAYVAGEEVDTFARQRELPVYQPNQLYSRAFTSAMHGLTDEKELKNVKVKAGDDLREIFVPLAEQVISEVGTNPENERDRWALKFLLHGALRKYDDEKSLTQHAEKFLFNRDRQMITVINRAKSETGNPLIHVKKDRSLKPA